MRHDRDVRSAFTDQVESFASAGVANADDVLDEIVALAGPAPDQRWIEAACGPGIIARRLARHVAAVEGIDLTPAMVAKATADATAAGILDVSFGVGDICALDRPDDHYDGAVTRFSVHHLPVPRRMFAELARVVRPGGRIVVVDHVADDDADALVWSQSIERLRDPSHWTCHTVTGLRSLGTDAGLRLVTEKIRPVEIDFEDWLVRGGVDAPTRTNIEDLLAHRPRGADSFSVESSPHGPLLRLRMWFGVFTHGDDRRICTPRNRVQ